MNSVDVISSPKGETVEAVALSLVSNGPSVEVPAEDAADVDSVPIDAVNGVVELPFDSVSIVPAVTFLIFSSPGVDDDGTFDGTPLVIPWVVNSSC